MDKYTLRFKNKNLEQEFIVNQCDSVYNLYKLDTIIINMVLVLAVSINFYHKKKDLYITECIILTIRLIGFGLIFIFNKKNIHVVLFLYKIY